MTIGIFGGTFDPIHNGHIQLANQFLTHLQLDEVWFMVTPQNPWKKNSQLAPDEFRLKLVETAIKNQDRLVASDYEFHLDKPSYTFKTLRHLSEDYPDDEFVLLIGADNWEKFDHWAEHEEILSNYRIAVYPREGCSVDTDSLPENVTFVEMELYNVSSTTIRQYLKEGKPVDEFVPQSIIGMLNQYTENE